MKFSYYFMAIVERRGVVEGVVFGLGGLPQPAVGVARGVFSSEAGKSYAACEALSICHPTSSHLRLGCLGLARLALLELVHPRQGSFKI